MQVAPVSHFAQIYGTSEIRIKFRVTFTPMRKQYLHLSAYICDECKGPVVSGLLAVRENEISRETDITPIGAICLSCGHRQPTMTEPGITHQFPPINWESAKLIEVQTPAS